MSTDFRALCARMADELDHYRQLLTDNRRETHALATEARTELAKPEPVVLTRPDCFEFAMDFLGGKEEAEVRNYIERLESAARAADLLERLASDNAGLAAAADSLYADNMSLLDNHHE
jgi:hypothetical protein